MKHTERKSARRRGSERARASIMSENGTFEMRAAFLKIVGYIHWYGLLLLLSLYNARRFDVLSIFSRAVNA